MKNKLAITFFLCFVGMAVTAQFANDWIDYNQRYFKIAIANDGLYEINASQLTAAGIPIASIPPERFQLFRRGQELAIKVDKSGSNVVTAISFYGKKNDGTGDTEMYRSPEAQAHTYHNLYTDTAAYFLTWKITGSGKRMANKTLLTPAAPEDYHLEKLRKLPVSSYSDGDKYGIKNELASGLFDQGEGWFGPRTTKGGVSNFTFALANIKQDAGVKPQVEVLMIGNNNLPHRTEILVGPSTGSLRSVTVVDGYENFESKLISSEIEWTDLSGTGQCVVQVKVLGFSDVADAQAVGFVKLNYPQTFDLPAGENKIFTLPATLDDRHYVRIATTNTAAKIYDITDPLNLVTRQVSVSTGALSLSVDNVSVPRKLYVVTAPLPSPDLGEVQMDQINLSQANFYIISHNRLMQNASDGINPVQAYADYRSSDFEVALVEIHEVYNQFNYGDPSAIAIKNLMKAAVGSGEPQYLFLIGKTTDLKAAYYRTANPNVPMLVPTYGVPGSDALFSVGITDPYVPAVPTGRLSAYTSEDVKNYFAKVKAMELLPYDALWRKNILQLSGGGNTLELSVFAQYMEGFKNIAESDFLGGKTFKKQKQSAGIDYINVADEVNRGVGMITFFGHSSSSVTDIEIGRATAAAGYSNEGKYPVIYMNGCNGGAIFGETYSFGEDWMAAKSLGAVAVLAQSDIAISTNLKRFSDLFYTIAFGQDDTFGMSIGDIMVQTQVAYFGSNFSDESLSHVYGTLLQGDPAIKIFGANKPDYALKADEITAHPVGAQRIVSSSDKFEIDVIVRNYGKTSKDSLLVHVNRTLSNGNTVIYNQKFLRPLYIDTLTVEITNNSDQESDGDNLFAIVLDPDNETDELNELNNSANFQLYIPKGSTINLYPQDFGVTRSATVKFVWQSADMLSLSRQYSFECDTAADFSSAYKITGQQQGLLLIEKTVDLGVLPDSTTLYWRTKFTDPQSGEDDQWVTASFSYLASSNSNWAQTSALQIVQNSVSGMVYNELAQKWEFLTTTLPVEIANHGRKNANNFTYNDIKVNVNGESLIATSAPADPFCRVNTFNAVVFDKETTTPIRPLGFSGAADVNNDLVCGKLPQMIHNFTNDEIKGANRYLDLLISKMDDGDAILLFSFDSVRYSQWDAQLKTSLASVGVSTSIIDALVDGQPCVFLGKKGITEGEAVALVDNGSGLPKGQQALSFIGNVEGVYSSAQIRTRKIGPAKIWNQLQFRVNEQGDDVIALTVFGIDANNKSQVLITTNDVEELDLNQIDAAQFPYIELQFDIKDEDNLKPTKLKNWALDYVMPAEGILLAEKLPKVTLDEGATYEKSFRFYNFSTIDFSDSLQVTYKFGSGVDGLDTKTFNTAPLLAGDTTTFSSTFSTVGKAGVNNLSVSVRPMEPEQYRLNNSVILANVAEVVQDATNPVLDVTFDGSYILNGDIVSPNPRIIIKFKDNNPYLYKKDTTGIDLMLKSPCENCDFERVTLSSNKVNYVPASESDDFQMDYNPGPLSDGVYQLQVQGRDESGNLSGAEPYTVSFEVISESTITRFYPYPNPFSTSTRFVFTLTGSDIPDQIKIQIMTVSGRVVREITDIGPIKIGNNISQYAWDGKDEYGDQLANGVYLYKVFVRKGGQEIKNRGTSADRAFKHGFGKMYILR